MKNIVYTITEITRIIKSTLEENPELINIWIRGEISNLTYHSSGHIYLSLKDAAAVISSVFFRYVNRSLNFRLEEGMSILAFGSINVFERRGSYQFIISEVRLEGLGELLKRIEQLKKRLHAEGIFDESNKKKIPLLPRRVGVVTSPTGAAIQDIIKIAMRRFPNIEIIIAPVIVQGEDAALSIARGIEELNSPGYGIDVIIAGRGGGSFEDLLPFNDEIVVRAFYSSKVPIISAVGHQIDHPLSDDAADFAAPTPSAAAEIAIPVKDELHDYLERLGLRSCNALKYQIKEMKARIDGIIGLRIYRYPMDIINNRQLILSDIQNRLISFMKEMMAEYREHLLLLPDLRLSIRNYIKDKTHRLNLALQGLEKLSPLGILKRGYSIATDEELNIIKSIKELKGGDNMNLIMVDGLANCSVKSVKSEVYHGKKKESNV